MPTVKQRPAWLRALGHDEPPTIISIDGTEYRLVEVYKHDSWAATAQYCRKNALPELDHRTHSHTGTESNANALPYKIICKFNRRASCVGIPLSWIGRALANRERHAYVRLADLPAIPSALGPVHADGILLPNAFAHEFVEGHPLGEHERPADTFFEELKTTLQQMHSQGVVYMDLHKRENILVGNDGQPKLVDFQISFQHKPHSWFLRRFPGRVLRDILRRSDLFCFEKHVRRLRPDQCSALQVTLNTEPPWWIRLHRCVAVPFRQSRRRLLSWLRVRDRSGRCRSELFAEHAFREPISRKT